ncbi:hypothetical protein QBC43DRAFT_293530 [Cladorrhinum sp. PSN259]|nr:hypothetical protein QBC43DRAFT_293530 [Cladorrhinum sp. PSN259]
MADQGQRGNGANPKRPGRDATVSKSRTDDLLNSNPLVDPALVMPRRSCKSLGPSRRSSLREKTGDRSTHSCTPVSRSALSEGAAVMGSPGPSETELQLREMIRIRDEMIKERDLKISKLVGDLINTQLEFRRGAPLDDSDLIASWKSLEHSISQLVIRRYDAGPGNTIVCEEAMKAIARDLCNSSAFSYNDIQTRAVNLRRPLLEAYIWGVLLNKVFGATGHIWAGRAHHSISKLRSELEDYAHKGLLDEGEYMQWFSRTAAMMEFVYNSDHFCSAKVRTVVTKIKENLYELEKESPEGPDQDLLGIASAACDLDFKMAKSNAQYLVFMYSRLDTSPNPPVCPKYGMKFDSENMQDTFSAGMEWRNRIVDVVRSPGIIKIGTGLGSEYGVATILVKRRTVKEYMTIGNGVNVVSIRLANRRDAAELREENKGLKAEVEALKKSQKAWEGLE